jgi:hypothetical protein
MVPGGKENVAAGNYSFAGGKRAKADHHGTFVWADIEEADFTSTYTNTFRVRAGGGAKFIANSSDRPALVGTNQGTGYALYADAVGSVSAYFENNIEVQGSCIGCSTSYLAINMGSQPLEAGDLVSPLGVSAPGSDTDRSLLAVELASAQGAGVIGVVQSRAEISAVEWDGQVSESVQRAKGSAASGEYLLVVVHGIAEIKASATKGEIVAGARLTVADEAGHARALQSRTVDGMVVTEGTPVIGVALAAPEPGKNTIPVFVTLH